MNTTKLLEDLERALAEAVKAKDHAFNAMHDAQKAHRSAENAANVISAAINGIKWDGYQQRKR